MSKTDIHGDFSGICDQVLKELAGRLLEREAASSRSLRHLQQVASDELERRRRGTKELPARSIGEMARDEMRSERGPLCEFFLAADGLSRRATDPEVAKSWRIARELGFELIRQIADELMRTAPVHSVSGGVN